MIKPIFYTTFFLIFVGGILFIYKEHYNSKDSQNPNLSKQKLLEQLDTKELNSINIHADGSSLSLIQLEGGGWREKSMNYEADTVSIQDLLLKLSEIKLGDLVTKNGDYHKRFRLLDPPENDGDWKKDIHGNSLTLLRGDGTIILSLLIGKKRKNGEGQYIRHTGSDNVFLISEQISLNAEIDDWLNKELLTLDPKQIASLEIKSGDKRSFSMNRKSSDAKWESVLKNNNTSTENLNNALERLSRLSFSKLYNNDLIPEDLLGSMEESLFVSLFDGRIYTLKLRKNLQSNENYILNLRMGILQDVSENANTKNSELHKEMKSFNQKMNGRFFEIRSWEGKELLLIDE